MWQQLILHLQARGVSQYAMAQCAKVDQSTISRLAKGQGEPRHSAGEALIELAGGRDALLAVGIDIAVTKNVHGVQEGEAASA